MKKNRKKKTAHTQTRRISPHPPKTQGSLAVYCRRHARFKFCILHSAASWTACLKCRCGPSRSPLNALMKKKKNCVCECVRVRMSVFPHKQVQCCFNFVSGTDFSLAFGLLLCQTNNKLIVCANRLCLISPSLFCLCCLCVLCRCIMSDITTVVPECQAHTASRIKCHEVLQILFPGGRYQIL